MAWVPLLVTCRFVNPPVAIKLGFIAGLAWWLPSISWLTHVSYMGWFTLAVYCALYTVPIAFLVSWWPRTVQNRSWWTDLTLSTPE